MGVFEAVTTATVHLNCADMEAQVRVFEPGLSVAAVPVGAQLWHLTAGVGGSVWEGLASSEDIDRVSLVATVSGNAIP